VEVAAFAATVWDVPTVTRTSGFAATSAWACAFTSEPVPCVSSTSSERFTFSR
jgi:hypothetical protein